MNLDGRKCEFLRDIHVSNCGGFIQGLPLEKFCDETATCDSTTTTISLKLSVLNASFIIYLLD